MSAIGTVVENVKAPIGWAKAKPLGWFLFVLVVILFAIRFREKIASALSKVPVIGKWLTGIAAAAAFVVWTSMAPPRIAVVAQPSAPLADHRRPAGYFHGHAMLASSSLRETRSIGGFVALPAARSGNGGAS